MLWLFLYKKIEKGKESSWSQKIAYDFFIDVLVCVERNWDIWKLSTHLRVINIIKSDKRKCNDTGGPNNMKINREGIGTSVKSPKNTAFDNLTNAEIGFSK